MMQDSESDDFSGSDYEEVDIENSGSDASVCILYFVLCKSGDSRSPEKLRMGLIEKIISGNHCDEFSATSSRPRISPSPLGLTSGHF
ncbi:hypothetical protein TNCV_4689341 [Trichonephila clavipes]|nr:hypothetical protein TNCV_4689341 [Trichonephila clavipes]